MHSLEKHIEQTIDRLGLLRRSSPVIVALSGGADSVALLSVLTALGYDCIAAHCNFQLRGKESLRDMRHAEAIARKLGVNIYVREFNVAERMKKTGESVEMACRELRYKWFHELLDRDYSQAIAVGHHSEDNVETFFLNLLRSSGLKGLKGMDYRNGYVVRPMLDVRRREIEEYLADKGLEYITDSSNNANYFKRNRLRNIILPSLEEHFPGSTDSILASMRHLADAQLIVEMKLHEIFDNTADDKMDIVSLITQYGERAARILLFEQLKTKGFNASQTANICRAAVAQSTGLRFETGGDVYADFDRGILSLHSRRDLPRENEEYAVSLKHDILTPVNIAVMPHDITQFNPSKDRNVMYLDVRALEGKAVFSLRHPKTGDRMKPYGMEGEKLVSDILKDAKFTSDAKRRVWLLTRNDQILWIVGVRASSLFTVTPRTRRFLTLTLEPPLIQ